MRRDKLSWAICFLSVSVAFAGSMWAFGMMLATRNLWYLAWMAGLLFLMGAAELNRDTDILVHLTKKKRRLWGWHPSGGMENIVHKY